MFGRRNSNDTVQAAYNKLWRTNEGDDENFNNEQQHAIFPLTSNDTRSITTSYNNAANTTSTLSLPINSSPVSQPKDHTTSEITNHPKQRSSFQPPVHKISNEISTILDVTVNGKPNSQPPKSSKLIAKQKSTDKIQLDSKNSTNAILDNAEQQSSTCTLSPQPNCLNYQSSTSTSSSSHVSLSNFISTKTDDNDSENDECTSNNIKLSASTKKFLSKLNVLKKLPDNIPSNANGQSTLVNICSDNVKQNVEAITEQNIKPEIRKRKPYTKRAKSIDNMNIGKRKRSMCNNAMVTSDISTTTPVNSNAVTPSYSFHSIYYKCSNKDCKLLVEHTCKQNHYDFNSLIKQWLNNDTKTVIESNTFVTIEPKKLHVCTRCSFSIYHSSCILLGNDENSLNSISTRKLFCKHCNFTANYCTKHSQFCNIVEQSCAAITLCSCECLNATHYCN